jgi:hypothetical protein
MRKRKRTSRSARYYPRSTSTSHPLASKYPPGAWGIFVWSLRPGKWVLVKVFGTVKGQNPAHVNRMVATDWARQLTKIGLFKARARKL